MTAAVASAQMVTGAKMPGYAESFGLTENSDIEVHQLSIETSSTTMVNVLHDGEQARIVFHVTNHSQENIHTNAVLRLVHYGTAVPEGDIWVPHVFRISDIGSAPVELNIARGGIFAATLVRVITPEPGRVQFPTYALDTDWPQNMNEGVTRFLKSWASRESVQGRLQSSLRCWV